MKLEFSRQILEKYSNIKFIKIRPVGAEFLHGDGRTDTGQTDEWTVMTKLIVAFGKFANAPRKVL
jgi:hypothetical protein